MNSLNFFSFVLISILLTSLVKSQIAIDGTVTDSDLNPIANALVEIIDEKDTNNTYSKVTDASGYFFFANITDIPGQKNIPSNHIILRNYPNPFNPTTVIYFELPKSENIEIKIYDILGREVRTLYNNFKKAGIYHMTWDGRNNSGGGVAAGIYFCRLKTKDQFKVHKMMLLDGGSNSPLAIKQKVLKTESTPHAKVNGIFKYTVRVSGETIISTEFNHIVCTRDTSITLIISKILKAQIIGPMGGVVELDNFSMNIPEGAFDSDFELKLFEKDADKWDIDNISKIIGVEGLPLKYNSPLDITIVPEEQLIEESYITVGQDYELPFTNTSEIVYDFMETKDSLGILKCELSISSSPTEINTAKSKSSKYKQHKIYFTAKTGFITQLSYNKHFKVFDKKHEYWLIKQEVCNKLEWNYNLLRDEGFDTTSVNWPVEVYVKKLNPNLEKRGCIYYPTFGLKNMSLLIDQDRILSITYSSLRECAIGILRTYDQDFFLPNEFTGKVDPSRYWFHHATASWFEEKRNKQWDDDFPYFPIDFQISTVLHVSNEGSGDNRIAPFSGMLAGAGSTSLSALKHGGGMSSFIKYLDLNYGSSLILLIYDQIKRDKINPIEAINNLMADSYLWWPDYLENYMESNIYESFDKQGAFNPYDEPKPLHDIIAGEHTFENISDTLKSFKDIKYHPLSAKVYKIGWSPNALDTSRVLRISTTDLNNNTLFVYGEFGHDYVLLGKGVSFIMSIKELLSTQVNGNNIGNLRVVVTNSECSPPYNNLTNINLEVKLEKPKELRFKYCDINFAVIEMHDTLEGVWAPGWYTVGSFKDNIFDGIINTEKQGGNASGKIKIEVDNNQNILSLSVMAYHNDPTGFSSQWGFTANNIPPTENEPYLLVHSYQGNEVCNYVTSIYGKYTEADGDETVIQNFKCDDESVLHIKFHNWD